MTELKAKILADLEENPTISLSAEKIARKLNMTDAEDFTPIVQSLAQLEREGKVEVTDSGEFKLVPQKQLITGVFHGNSKGFGFVAYDDSMPDIYVNPDHTKHALSGDEVQVKILRAGDPGSAQGPEGQVEEIIAHHYDHVVGEFKNLTMGNYIGEIILKDKKLSHLKFYVSDKGLHPQDGEIVTATIENYPTDDSQEVLTGAVTEVVGDKNEPGIDILSVVYAHDVPHEFPKEAMDQANQIPLKVLPEEKKGRGISPINH